MTEHRDQSTVARVWPRTVEGWCSCPYCTANREGTLPAIEAPRKRDWLERMGGRGGSVAAELVRDGFR
jgi:hypothetical protein